ncbi:MAG: GGDEF domain-containing protein [Proteobacteria bacterium]|nr:GGDEF domain-containing protein [Pseudomonadota bacterium]
MRFFSNPANSSKGGQEDLRDTTHYPAGEEPEKLLLNRTSNYLGGFELSDILGTSHHTEDFKATRSEYVVIRLRVMLIIFTLAVPAWIVIDLNSLERGHLIPMIVARMIMTGTLLMILMQSMKKLTHLRVSVLLVLTMLASTIFYSAAMIILHSGIPEKPLAGYEAMPFMAIAFMGLFPATLIYSLSVMGMIILSYVGLEFWLGSLFTIETINTLWILFMIAGVALIIETGQLLMLLKLYRESTRDPLTGLINRRVLMKQFSAEIDLQEESGRGFSIFMFDLDRFKRVNDAHGHLMGDIVLKKAAELMQEGLRSTDVLARFGGEEFIAILPGQSGTESIPVADRIREEFQNTVVVTDDGAEIRLSTSIGVTEYEPGEKIEDALNRVDDSLYRAKEMGRNLVVYSQSYPTENGITLANTEPDQR